MGCGSCRLTCRRPTSARHGSCPRSSATPSWTASRCAPPGVGPSRRWTVPPAARIPRLWARVPGHLTPSAATLAIFGDYVSGAVSQPLGRRAMGRSLDNTLRMVQLKPTEWVLCDIRIHALVGGYGQGHRVPLVGGRGPPGDRQSVDRCALVAGGRCTPRLTPGCDDRSHRRSRETVPHGSPRDHRKRRRPSGKITAAAVAVWRYWPPLRRSWWWRSSATLVPGAPPSPRLHHETTTTTAPTAPTTTRRRPTPTTGRTRIRRRPGDRRR